MRQTAGGREIGLDHVEAVMDILAGLRREPTFPAAAWNFGAESWSYYEQKGLVSK